MWFLGTFPKYNKSENIPDVYQSWYSKISNQNFHIKEIVLLVAEMRAFQVINQSLKSNCFMYQLLLFWFQKCMIARYFPTNNRSESSRTVTKDQIQIYTNLEIMNLYKFGENLGKNCTQAAILKILFFIKLEAPRSL